MTRTNRASRQEIDVPLPVTLIGGALIFWAIGHAAMTRTWMDFVRYPLYVVVPGTAVLYVFLVREWWKSTPHTLSSEHVWMAATLPFAFYVAAALYYAVGASIKDAYFWLQALDLTRNGKIALAVGITLVAGLVLFVFRLKLRSTYGLTEALVGLVVAGSRVSSDIDKLGSDPALYLTVLTAGVYLVVRGLDNVHQGLAKDPIALKLLGLMHSEAAPAPALPTTAPPPPPTPAVESALPAEADPARGTVA